MLPTSHFAPTNVSAAAGPVLAEAFGAFTAAAGQLETSYQQLHAEVVRLREELEQRNAALTASLAENENMRLALERILETLPCGVVVVERDGEMSFANPESRRLLGDGFAESVMARLKGIEEGEQELCVNVEDKKRWLGVRSAALYRGESESCRSAKVLIIRDVTSQRDLEREREEARGLIALAEMSSVLAHEIRNPLGSMELLVSLLAGSGNLNPEQQGWTEHLQAGMRSLSATLNNVLRVNSAGSASLRSLPLGPVLRDGIKFIAPLAERAGVGVSLREDLGDIEIRGNAGELQQVLMNLALNALRHMPEGGKIEIKAVLRQDRHKKVAAMEFRDTGCGIPAEYLGNIFDAGFSTGHTPGLGLAVCRKIVQQHNGRISVESHVGQGATFHMEFPIL